MEPLPGPPCVTGRPASTIRTWHGSAVSRAGRRSSPPAWVEAPGRTRRKTGEVTSHAQQYAGRAKKSRRLFSKVAGGRWVDSPAHRLRQHRPEHPSALAAHEHLVLAEEHHRREHDVQARGQERPGSAAVSRIGDGAAVADGDDAIAAGARGNGVQRAGGDRTEGDPGEAVVLGADDGAAVGAGEPGADGGGGGVGPPAGDDLMGAGLGVLVEGGLATDARRTRGVRSTAPRVDFRTPRSPVIRLKMDPSWGVG